jgi:hypothetical protein
MDINSTFVDDLRIVPENITDLEDPTLTKHMDNLRDIFLKYKVKVNPNPLDIVNNDKNIRVLLSEIIIELKEQYLDIRHIADHLYIHTINAKQLSEGTRPYIYQECKTSSEIFNKMSNIMSENNKKLEEISYNVEEIDHKIVKMRRLYESILSNVTDNL